MNTLDQIRLTTQRHLTFHAMTNPDQKEVCEKVLKFMERVDNPFTRKNLSGHITSSAWIVDQDVTKTVLIHHNLDIWIQPGGHLEVQEYPAQGAVREAMEETGLQNLMIAPPGLLDVDVHTIPHNARKGEPEHAHYDLRYLMLAEGEELSIDLEEVRDARWIDLRHIVDNPGEFLPSIVRMAQSTLAVRES